MISNLILPTSADINIGKNLETVNPMFSNMYITLLTLENCKKTHTILENKIAHLNSFSAATPSGARKRQAIPKLESEQKNLKKFFDALVPIIEKWVANFAPENKIFGDAILEHYCDFKKKPESLQLDLDLLGLNMTASNFRAKLQQIWLDEFQK